METLENIISHWDTLFNTRLHFSIQSYSTDFWIFEFAKQRDFFLLKLNVEKMWHFYLDFHELITFLYLSLEDKARYQNQLCFFCLLFIHLNLNLMTQIKTKKRQKNAIQIT